MDLLPSTVTTIGVILAAMAALALLESVIPLRARGRWGRAHLAPNLALTFLTFATNAALVTLARPVRRQAPRSLLRCELDAEGRIRLVHAVLAPQKLARLFAS